MTRKNVKIEIAIQSVSDIITNSSSEVFIIEAQGQTAESLKKILEGALSNDRDHMSGMGGELDVYDNSTQNSDPDPYDDDLYPYKWLPDGYFAIDFDWGYEGLKAFMQEKFKLVDCPDRRCLIDKETGEFAGYYVPDYDKSKYKDVPGGKFDAECRLKYYTKRVEELVREVQEMADEMGFGSGDKRKKLEKIHELMNTQAISECNAKYASQELKRLNDNYYHQVN